GGRGGRCARLRGVWDGKKRYGWRLGGPEMGVSRQEKWEKVRPWEKGMSKPGLNAFASPKIPNNLDASNTTRRKRAEISRCRTPIETSTKDATSLAARNVGGEVNGKGCVMCQKWRFGNSIQ